MNRIETTHNIQTQATLYRVVFQTRSMRYITSIVFLFFVLHPAVPAFASEYAEVVSNVNSQNLEESLPSPATDPVSDNAATIDDVPVAPIVDTQEAVLEESIVPPHEPEAETETEIIIENEGSSDTGAVGTTVLDIVEDNENQNIAISQDSIQEDSIQQVLSSVVGTTTDTATEGAPVTTNDSLPGESLTENVDIASTTEDIDENIQTPGEDVEQTVSTTTITDEVQAPQVAGVSTTTDAVTDVLMDSGVDTAPGGGATNNLQQQENASGWSASDNTNQEPSVALNTEGDTQVSTTTQQTQATSTPDAIVTPIQTNTVTNNLNAYQFADKECISVGDGSFYCSAIDGAPEYVEDGVFSAPDVDGDKEIYVTIDGVTTQITFNLTDDASPYYDALSDTIVWHSMKNDRFQIVQYDVATGKSTYLTDTSYNNMEPVAYGDLVLWQAWIGNNWEIMMRNNGTITQLTNNTMHDITPHIRDGYIIWQTQFAEGWKIALYDMQSKKIQYIADGDGSEVANPRFVLVYDSMDTVGDTQTKGYDFGSGVSFVLGSLPAEVPTQIPQPDQTGETRALIQAKPTARENEVRSVVPITSGNGSTTSTNTASSSIRANDLIIEPLATTTTSAVATTIVRQQQVISTSTVSSETPTKSTSTDTAHIQDVVIPPFSASSTQEVG